ncbi:MAG: hypothetical protein AVDCRST_MAG74-3851 [uncultured Pyrinomonadaceae bacterium]|uniref:Uncharacterized protein n=1 Tax=uncultured Pyrinomonadaceae bacterium TaxID=2283094 RepID=A0A6J4Q493_9BACT|nr:MAG: hypothetical protein AVDCRST_MAG74-3851 [uncultured Pyrinomonadaceae bacterium]
MARTEKPFNDALVFSIAFGNFEFVKNRVLRSKQFPAKRIEAKLLK